MLCKDGIERSGSDAARAQRVGTVDNGVLIGPETPYPLGTDLRLDRRCVIVSAWWRVCVAALNS